MSTKTKEAIIVDETLRAEAEDFVNKIDDIQVTDVEVRLSNGDVLPLPPRLAKFIERMIEAATAQTTRIMSLPDELTTTVAADQLGVSRPTLIKWAQQGKIDSHKVGSHHRFKTSDVQKLAKQLHEEKERAFAGLRALDEQLEE